MEITRGRILGYFCVAALPRFSMGFNVLSCSFGLGCFELSETYSKHREWLPGIEEVLMSRTGPRFLLAIHC
jgi:hypothetical protein